MRRVDRYRVAEAPVLEDVDADPPAALTATALHVTDEPRGSGFPLSFERQPRGFVLTRCPLTQTAASMIDRSGPAVRNVVPTRFEPDRNSQGADEPLLVERRGRAHVKVEEAR